MTAHLDAATARNIATGLAALEERVRAKRGVAIVVEALDGTEGMVACADCQRVRGCRDHIPHQNKLARHCAAFRSKT